MVEILIVICTIILAFFVFVRPKIGVYYLILYTFLLGSMIIGDQFQKESVISFLPRIFSITYDGTILALFFSSLFVRKKYFMPSFYRYVIALFVMGTLAAIIHNVGFAPYLWQLRRTLLYFLIPFALINCRFDETFYKSIFKLILDLKRQYIFQL